MNPRDEVRHEGSPLMICKGDLSRHYTSTRHEKILVSSGYYSSMVDTFTLFCFTQDGRTALVYATVRGKCDVVTELIYLGADVDIQDNVSCLHCLIMTLASGLCRTTRVHSLLTYAKVCLPSLEPREC